MNISQLGEWGFIQRLSQKFIHNFQDSTIGIGDDAAVIPLDEKNSLLVTTDMLVEDSHFLRAAIPARDLGHKSLAVNLSDIAAMGGKPTSAFLSMGLPPDLKIDWLDSFFEGFQQLAEAHNVQLLGGDTTESKKGIVINITVLGKIENSKIKLRSKAKAGDVICVTGKLGDSIAGLKCLLENKPETEFSRHLIHQHHHPIPHMKQGQWLAQFSSVHAMMDISDGLDVTVKQIIEKSKCGALIHLNELPLSDQLKEASDFYGWGAPVLAAAGGEDYCLALTIAENEFEQICHDYLKEFSEPLMRIGSITDQVGTLAYELDGNPFLGPIKAWDHFS